MKVNGKSSVELFVINKIERFGFGFEKSSISQKDGVKIVGSRRSEKTIKVDFTICDDKLTVPEIKRRMDAFIKESDNKISFDDEPNLYYMADLTTVDLEEITQFLATGTITFVVPDGLAHSVELTPFTATVNDQGILSVDIDYDGTVETPLEINIKNIDETGYLSAIGVNGEESTFITQLGYVDEADGETRTKMQTVRSKENGKNFADWQNASVFYENQAKKIVTTMTATSDFGGWLGFLPTSFSNSGYSYYGACKELIFDTPMKYCYTWARAWFETGRMGQTGEWCLAYVDEDNHFIAGMAIEKDDAVGNTANIRFLIGDGNGGSTVFKAIQYTPSYWIPPNPYGSQSRDTNRNMFDLTKEGAKITYFWNGGYYTHNVPALENKRVKRLQFYVGQYGSQPA